MALDAHFIPAFSIEDVLLDKDTGAPLAGGLVYFEEDNQRGILKPVYQITGTSPNYSFTQLPNPMTLSSIGTFEDSLSNPVIPYFFPYDSDLNIDLYYVRVVSSDDVPQFAREAVPYIADTGDGSLANAFVNELSNPQFAEVLFDTNLPSYIFTFDAASQEVVDIAPDWSIVVSCAGVGSVTVQQITPIGSLNRITNPGTILNINSTGLSRLRLRQRLYGSPNLWGSGYLSASFIAKTYSGTDVNLTLYYSQSDGIVVDETIVSATLEADGLYAAHAGSVLIPASTSTQDFPFAYVDIEFSLPLSIEIDITSVMLAGTADAPINGLIYDQTSLARQLDQLFHYYQPQLEYKPIPSYTLGWNFPFNPCQELGYSVPPVTLGGGKSRYIADQTILFSNTDNTIGASISEIGINFSTSTSSSFALIQYLDATTAYNLLTQRLAIQLQGQSALPIIAEIHLYWTAAGALPNLVTPNCNSLVSVVSPIGTPTVGGGGVYGTWTEVPRSDLGTAFVNLVVASTAIVPTYSFNGWDARMEAGIDTATFFAIVISFATLVPANQVVLEYVSLCAGDIATPPAAMNMAEIINGLEYYYETSYNIGTAPLQSSPPMSAPSSLTSLQTTSGSSPVNAYPAVFGFRYNSVKRSNPTVTLYSFLNATPGSVTATIYNNGASAVSSDVVLSTYWTPITAGEKGYFAPGTSAAAYQTAAAASVVPYSLIDFHYVVDARFGIA